MTTYSPVPASTVGVGDKLRQLRSIAPADPQPGYDDMPVTVARVQPLDAHGSVRIWAHPFTSLVSRVSPADYGSFTADAPVLRADS